MERNRQVKLFIIFENYNYVTTTRDFIWKKFQHCLKNRMFYSNVKWSLNVNNSNQSSNRIWFGFTILKKNIVFLCGQDHLVKKFPYYTRYFFYKIYVVNFAKKWFSGGSNLKKMLKKEETGGRNLMLRLCHYIPYLNFVVFSWMGQLCWTWRRHRSNK